MFLSGMSPSQLGLPAPVAGSEFYIDGIVFNMPSCDGFSVTVSGTHETAIGAMDGTATANPVGGTAPYQYRWSNLETTQPDKMIVRLIGLDGSTTAVGHLDTTTGDVNINHWYGLDGQKVGGRPTKSGLYINNGKKIVVK